MTRRVITRGDNPWHRDGRDPIAKLRDAAVWEHQVRRNRLRAHFIGWATASGIGLLFVGAAALLALAINGAL